VKRRLVLALGSLGLVVAACGGRGAGGPSTPPGAAAAKDGSASGAADAGAPDAAPPAKPFAGSPTEATQLIGDAIDKNGAEIKKCVGDYRARKKLPHQRVEISVGIDQDGRLLGATSKGGKQDPAFSECLQRALSGAQFPRSHAGVIQVTKSYEEIEQ